MISVAPDFQLAGAIVQDGDAGKHPKELRVRPQVEEIVVPADEVRYFGGRGEIEIGFVFRIAGKRNHGRHVLNQDRCLAELSEKQLDAVVG